jgi:hypothetical protein
MHIQKVYQLKVALPGSEPPIWRRILVTGDIDLSGLHAVLQISMGWTDSHKHQFERDGQVFGNPRDGSASAQMLDESHTPLDQVLRGEKDALWYQYDFGDRWDHLVTLEKILPHDRRLRLPVCVEAAGACPPEDVGGIWGYYDLLDALSDPRHPDHAELIVKYGAYPDPDAFDVHPVNEMLKIHFNQAA